MILAIVCVSACVLCWPVLRAKPGRADTAPDPRNRPRIHHSSFAKPGSKRRRARAGGAGKELHPRMRGGANGMQTWGKKQNFRKEVRLGVWPHFPHKCLVKAKANSLHSNPVIAAPKPGCEAGGPLPALLCRSAAGRRHGPHSRLAWDVQVFRRSG